MKMNNLAKVELEEILMFPEHWNSHLERASLRSIIARSLFPRNTWGAVLLSARFSDFSDFLERKRGPATI